MSFEVGGLDDDWIVGDGQRGEVERCGSEEAAEEL
jgi:hypothetical protein